MVTGSVAIAYIGNYSPADISKDNYVLRLFVSVCNHCLNPVNIRGKAPQLHLLALAGLDCQRIRINPLVSGNLGRLRGIGEDVEDCWLVYNWQEGHTRHDLLENGPNFCLYLFLGFCRNRVPDNGSFDGWLSKITVQRTHLASVPSSPSVWTRLMSNTHRSSGVRVSFEIMARTSWVMDPVSSHSKRDPSCSSSTARNRQPLTLYLFQYPMSPLTKSETETEGVNTNLSRYASSAAS